MEDDADVSPSEIETPPPTEFRMTPGEYLNLMREEYALSTDNPEMSDDEG
jgi:hypothetical protein